MTDVWVVTYGSNGCVEDVHGVFGEQERAELAAEELARVYDHHSEFVSVEAHEFVPGGVGRGDDGE